MRSKIIILSARAWQMTDEKTNETRTGVSVQYIWGDDLKPVSDSSTGILGYQVAKESISTEVAGSLSEVPGVYDASFDMRASGGKNVLHINGLNFVKVLGK